MLKVNSALWFQFVSLDESRPWPSLVQPLYGSCAVKFTNTKAILMGGKTTTDHEGGDASNTFVYSMETNEWSAGPGSLSIAR